ncbi:trans-sulfuration enzyme family protein [Aureibaculum conchae]|uniref:trans-sulfuration enzyme family protein n=1 Tax=Aureibaculum sp. 2308TA14-22 TaxID=3108392 RepID=UPI0033917612
MKTKKHGVNTICTHTGEVKDKQFGGAISPIYMTTSYPFMDVDSKRYPRYFNTPNQQAVASKIAALENAEAGLLFGSGMAAISTTLFAFLNHGDHVVLQNEIYGGTFNLIVEEFDKMGIEYSFTKGIEAQHFEEQLKSNTKVIYIETPSNPLLSITDIEAVANVAKRHDVLTMIDNTFASPINQTPLELGIDISIHSATKYLGGHSDISAGAVASTQENIDKIWNKAKNLGGHLSDFIAYLLERSIKTLGVRVDRHNANAQTIAEYLENHNAIERVYYPGLKSHPNHAIAKNQMHGFGGMLSFELKSKYNAVDFQNKLKLIKPSMSLAGVESTILLPSLTSHGLLTAEQRKEISISDNLLRFSVGIEDIKDIIEDIELGLKD